PPPSITQTHTLSLHDALPISRRRGGPCVLLLFAKLSRTLGECRVHRAGREHQSQAWPQPGLGSAHPRWRAAGAFAGRRSCSKVRSEEHTSELQSQSNLVCRLL